MPSTLKEHLQAKMAGRDLRACFADVFGYKVLSPQQEQHIEALQTQPRVAARGGTGVGKSFVQGTAAAMVVATSFPSKALFGGPRLEQALRLSWMELQRSCLAAAERRIPLSVTPLGVTDWYPLGKDTRPDWFAACMALSDRNQAAAVKGMMHSSRVLIVLDELEGVAPEVRDALDAGTVQDNAHYWVAFNPLSLDDAAGHFWSSTPEAGRVHYSAIDCAEWQERTGKHIPGMPTLAALKAKWAGRENEPLYYTNVLGEFPPESASWVVIPKDWYDVCRALAIVPDATDDARVGIGVDTAGGRAENVVAVARGRFVSVEWSSREQHQTPVLVARVKEVAQRYGGTRTPIAVDIVGQGGKGVADQLRADGYNALDFVGGGREFNGQTEATGLYADCATWAWFALRDAARLTTEGQPSVKFPADDLLREQLARRYAVASDRRYKLESKDSANSPDRADAVCMAWLAAMVRPAGYRIVTSEEVMPEMADTEAGGSIGERW